MWQRVALFWGWNKWDLSVKDAEIQEARDKVKKQKKKDKKQSGKKTKKYRCTAIKKDGKRCKNEVDKKVLKCYAHK
jgi:predicted RNA-binding protein with RPS1 domain